jgi:hypothetical protein
MSFRFQDPGLVRVSRQLHQETALLPYKLATFDFGLEETGWGEREHAIGVFLHQRLRVQIEALGKLQLRYCFGDSISEPGVVWIERLYLHYLLA